MFLFTNILLDNQEIIEPINENQIYYLFQKNKISSSLF